MKACEETTIRICNAIPAVTPEMLESVLSVASEDSQIIFVQGEGHKVIDGKSFYPDYMSVQISDAYEAMRLAQQLFNACADAIANGGALRAPVSLIIAGQALLSE